MVYISPANVVVTVKKARGGGRAGAGRCPPTPPLLLSQTLHHDIRDVRGKVILHHSNEGKRVSFCGEQYISQLVNYFMKSSPSSSYHHHQAVTIYKPAIQKVNLDISLQEFKFPRSQQLDCPIQMHSCDPSP